MTAVLRDLPEDSIVRDIGCGTGYVARRLIQGGARLVRSTDSDESAIDHALCNPHGLDQIGYGVLDSNKTMSYGDSMWDAILFGDSLEHMNNPQRQIWAASRALKPGGRMIVSTPNRWSHQNLAWNIRRRLRGYDLTEHQHQFSRGTLGSMLERFVGNVTYEYCTFVPHWYGLPVQAMRSVERELRDSLLMERTGWTMIATATKETK